MADTLKSIEELKGKHNGTPIVVIGGSPSLYNDFKETPVICQKIAANEHAYKVGLIPNYFCFIKDHNESENLMPFIKDPKGAIKISMQDKHTDYILTERWHGGFTGHLAVWLASYLTDSEIIIVGMDCYSGTQSYYYDRSNEWAEVNPTESHLRQWQKGIDNGFINPDRIYAVSGPLTTIFKQWQK